MFVKVKWEQLMTYHLSTSFLREVNTAQKNSATVLMKRQVLKGLKWRLPFHFCSRKLHFKVSFDKFPTVNK